MRPGHLKREMVDGDNGQLAINNNDAIGGACQNLCGGPVREVGRYQSSVRGIRGAGIQAPDCGGALARYGKERGHGAKSHDKRREKRIPRMRQAAQAGRRQSRRRQACGYQHKSARVS